MPKRIIIICHEPLTIKIKSNFYVDDFILAGFTVEYWDISQYIHPGIHLVGEVDENYVRKLNTYKSLKDSFDKTDIAQSIFVIEVIACWRNRRFFKLLSDKGCYTTRIDMYGNTILDLSLKDKLLHIEPRRILKILDRQIKQVSYNKYAAHYNIKGLDKVFSSSALIPTRIPINHPDYELYMDSRAYEKQEKFIVFLDVFFPLHPDLIYMMQICKVSVKKYQESLNHFFRQIEQKYNLPVVIAAHPKANYIGDEFENRKILKGDTVRLVREAALVLLHASNSVAYAILNNKPFELITNREYNKVSYLTDAQRKLALALGKPVYNVDLMDIDVFNASAMNLSERNKYIYSYLTSEETQNISNKDIILSQFFLL